MIQIEQKNGNLHIQITDSPTIEQITHSLLNTQLHVMRETLKKVPLPQQDAFKEQLYDMVNLKMSAVLESFAPEYEMRPGLTAEAIIKAENELLEDAMSKMQ